MLGNSAAGGGEAQQGSEGGAASATAVEAEDELVEVGMEMPAPEGMVGAQGPALEVQGQAMLLRQDDVSGHRVDDVWGDDAGGTFVGGPAVGPDGCSWGEVWP